jgi:hypothetical protein
MLGVPEERVRCIHTEGSGCYGHNGADDAAADAALIAQTVPGKPVRVQWMRDQEHLWERWLGLSPSRPSSRSYSEGPARRWGCSPRVRCYQRDVSHGGRAQAKGLALVAYLLRTEEVRRVTQWSSSCPPRRLLARLVGHVTKPAHELADVLRP